MTKEKIRVVAALCFVENRLLITRRPQGSHLGGLWEFPGGKIKNGETAQEALKREIKEELAADIRVKELFWQNVFEYDVKIVDIAFYFCDLLSSRNDIKPLGVSAIAWVQAEELARFEFPPADAALIEQLGQKGLDRVW